MKIIQHSVFVSSVVYPVLSLLSRTEGFVRADERRREQIRQQAEEFINGIGADKVVAVTEDAPTLGPFSVVVWWRRDFTDTREVTGTDALVIRAVDDKQSA
jgi:hypothetical protein